MGWVHDVPEDDLYSHEGYAVAVLADGSEPEPLQIRVGGEGATAPNSSWWVYNGHDGRPGAAGVKAACECGWRSAETFPIDWTDHEATEGFEFNDGPFGAWSFEHIASLLGTAMPRELREAIGTVAQQLREQATDRPLVVLAAIRQLETLIGVEGPRAGAAARQEGVTWDAIGKAIGTTRQAAFQRFGRHLPATAENDRGSTAV
ncbi:hypothetical protein [Streptomyces prunicolor]|uniref:DNA-binding protein n=1 Tax=Streptomyces prunicolor TaxID=67348 RepID=A0ABU4FQ54_9ACTN|nr:hypothetical protein [Streptomyces prunicolor]MDV7222751.1 hypothetical protein [Streptomyces prunicolor]